jgi:5,10-methylene-tetrahydrofolate dehydrogenase/methenyl tetrahydrofolate cyclohydrolase
MQYDLTGKTVAVVGLGALVGKPIAQWLHRRNVTVIELDKGFDEHELKQADLVILGTGSYTLNPALLQNGAAVIDFGYRRSDAGLSGDLDTSEEHKLAHLKFYTPTPGGTGPILIASLLENFALLNG